MYAACGRGPRSTLRVLRHGLEVTEMAVSELPGNPNAVWAVKKRAEGEHRTMLWTLNKMRKYHHLVNDEILLVLGLKLFSISINIFHGILMENFSLYIFLFGISF